MKKLIATLVIGTMILSMASCGKTETQNEASVESSAVSSEAVTTENAADTADTAIEAVEGNTTDEAASEDLADSATAEGAVLEDGSYYSSLVESTEFDTQVVKSIEFKDDIVVIEAAFSHFIGEDWDNMIQLENAVYTIPVSPDAEYIVGSGEDEPEKMTKEEFIKYISGLMNSGLSFDVTIEDGVAVGFGIWS